MLRSQKYVKKHYDSILKIKLIKTTFTLNSAKFITITKHSNIQIFWSQKSNHFTPPHFWNFPINLSLKDYFLLLISNVQSQNIESYQFQLTCIKAQVTKIFNYQSSTINWKMQKIFLFFVLATVVLGEVIRLPVEQHKNGAVKRWSRTRMDRRSDSRLDRFEFGLDYLTVNVSFGWVFLKNMIVS